MYLCLYQFWAFTTNRGREFDGGAGTQSMPGLVDASSDHHMSNHRA